eukprot:s3631_g7.t1
MSASISSSGKMRLDTGRLLDFSPRLLRKERPEVALLATEPALGRAPQIAQRAPQTAKAPTGQGGQGPVSALGVAPQLEVGSVQLANDRPALGSFSKARRRREAASSYESTTTEEREGREEAGDQTSTSETSSTTASSTEEAEASTTDESSSDSEESEQSEGEGENAETTSEEPQDELEEAADTTTSAKAAATTEAETGATYSTTAQVEEGMQDESTTSAEEDEESASSTDAESTTSSEKEEEGWFLYAKDQHWFVILRGQTRASTRTRALATKCAKKVYLSRVWISPAVERVVASSLRTFAMAPSYIHCYLLDCRQDLSNKGESSSQDRATMPTADVAPVALEQDSRGLKSDQNLLRAEFLAHPSCAVMIIGCVCSSTGCCSGPIRSLNQVLPHVANVENMCLCRLTRTLAATINSLLEGVKLVEFHRHASCQATMPRILLVVVQLAFAMKKDHVTTDEGPYPAPLLAAALHSIQLSEVAPVRELSFMQVSLEVQSRSPRSHGDPAVDFSKTLTDATDAALEAAQEGWDAGKSAVHLSEVASEAAHAAAQIAVTLQSRDAEAWPSNATAVQATPNLGESLATKLSEEIRRPGAKNSSSTAPALSSDASHRPVVRSGEVIHRTSQLSHQQQSWLHMRDLAAFLRFLEEAVCTKYVLLRVAFLLLGCLILHVMRCGLPLMGVQSTSVSKQALKSQVKRFNMAHERYDPTLSVGHPDLYEPSPFHDDRDKRRAVTGGE